MLKTWYIKRLEGNLRLIFEVIPAFCGKAVLRLRVKAHPLHKNHYIVDIHGTEFLDGTIFDWVVFANGTGSTSLVVEKGVTVPVQFNVEHLATYKGLMRRLDTAENATYCWPGPAAFRFG